MICIISGNHPDCPGSIDMAQRPEILARTRAARDGFDVWVCQGVKSLDDPAGDALGATVH